MGENGADLGGIGWNCVKSGVKSCEIGADLGEMGWNWVEKNLQQLGVHGINGDMQREI